MDMRVWGRVLAFSGLAALAGGCAGGGGCLEPLAAEFPRESRVENAATVRITEPGFQFLNDNIEVLLGASLGNPSHRGVVIQPIPTMSGQQGDVSYTICPDGPDLEADPPRCAVEIDLGNLGMALRTE